MRTTHLLGCAALLAGAFATVHAQPTLIVTATNAASNNDLQVYDTAGRLIQTVPTAGKGGASGNAGGVMTQGNVVAAVNFGSNSVAIFQRVFAGFGLRQLVLTAPNPVSVAFGHEHLYVLGATTVESHQMYGNSVDSNVDGIVRLLKADGSSAQVGFVGDHLVVSEKSNTIETVNLTFYGAVTGTPALVQGIPANVDAPFGLATRGNNAYVTIAHADEISLVRNGQVLTTTGAGGQHAPCWAALSGPFLYSANSPSKSLSRFAVYGQKIVLDAAVAAQFNGAPTDIAAAGNLIAVIDGSGAISHLSIFSVDEDGNLSPQAVTTINAAMNGVAIAPAPDPQP